MPLYDYQCTKCDHIVEIRHGFDAAPDAVCEKCGGALKRVFNPAPILFKGSGFYINDSRPAKNDGGSSEKTSESKPAESKPSEPKPSGSESAA